MVTLTATQEGALDLAGDVLVDLNRQGRDIRLMRGGGGRITAWADSRATPRTVFGKGDSASEAVTDLLRKLDELESAPPKLTTAKEALAAVTAGIEELAAVEPRIHREHLRSMIEGLPVA